MVERVACEAADDVEDGQGSAPHGVGDGHVAGGEGLGGGGGDGGALGKVRAGGGVDAGVVGAGDDVDADGGGGGGVGGGVEDVRVVAHEAVGVPPEVGVEHDDGVGGGGGEGGGGGGGVVGDGGLEGEGHLGTVLVGVGETDARHGQRQGRDGGEEDEGEEEGEDEEEGESEADRGGSRKGGGGQVAMDDGRKVAARARERAAWQGDARAGMKRDWFQTAMVCDATTTSALWMIMASLDCCAVISQRRQSCRRIQRCRDTLEEGGEDTDPQRLQRMDFAATAASTVDTAADEGLLGTPGGSNPHRRRCCAECHLSTRPIDPARVYTERHLCVHRLTACVATFDYPPTRRTVTPA